jgi:HlyD family secretion protein
MKEPAISKSVAALGRLEPRDPVTELGVASNERLDRLLVKIGQFVKAGDALAYLESYESRQADHARSAAVLEDAENRLRADRDQAKARIQEAALRLSQTKEVPPREIEYQEARIREIQSSLGLANKELARLRNLLRDGVISAQQFDRQFTETERLEASLAAERASLRRLTVATETDQQIAVAELATRNAEMDSILASAQLPSLRRAVSVAEAELKKSVIRAPIDGQIIDILARPGEAAGGKPLLLMGDVSQMYILAEVYETDVGRVSLDDAAEASSPALSASLKGRVERIGTSVAKRIVRDLDPQADVDARVVQVRIRLDDSSEAARFVGLQVNVRIATGK